MKKLIRIPVLGVVMCVLLFGQRKEGTGILAGNFGPHFHDSLPVRLCSIERVLQTTSDKRGAFVLTNVPVGTYEFVAQQSRWTIFTIKQVEIQAQRTESIVVNPSDPQPDDSICFRDTESSCGPRDFLVQYSSPRQRQSTILLGRIIDWESARQKGLANARIRVFRAGETNPAYTIMSDKRGRFQINLQPGIYDLDMSLRKFLDVKIPDFLVPLENDTEVTIRTGRRGSVAFCQ